jgi:hypothetical protein
MQFFGSTLLLGCNVDAAQTSLRDIMRMALCRISVIGKSTLVPYCNEEESLEGKSIQEFGRSLPTYIFRQWQPLPSLVTSLILRILLVFAYARARIGP